MSAINGIVEATHSVDFNSYQEADQFIDTLSGSEFEGIQVIDGRYIVNFTPDPRNAANDMLDRSEPTDECNRCGRTEYMCPGH